MGNIKILFKFLRDNCCEDLIYLFCIELHHEFQDIKYGKIKSQESLLLKNYDIPNILNNYLYILRSCSKNVEILNLLDIWLSDLENLEVQNKKEENEKNIIIALLDKTEILNFQIDKFSLRKKRNFENKLLKDNLYCKKLKKQFSVEI